MLLFTLLAMVVIDHAGRRKLMILGSTGYIVGLVGTAYAFYAKAEGALLLISLLIFIASHGFSQGAVIWVFISEILPNRVRARGQALGTFIHWAMSYLLDLSDHRRQRRGKAFAFYALSMIGQLAWVLTVMPETKGFSLERIQQELGIE